MASVVLSGFSGTGKTTVGPLVASRLGLPFLDTDTEIERRCQISIAELWRSRGESSLRRVEEALVRELFADGIDRVVAFGGGTLTNRALRHMVLDRAMLVTLTARPDVIVARVGDAQERPALTGPDPLARVVSLLEQRASVYAECHLSLATDGQSPEDVAARVTAAARQVRVAVALGRRTYSVRVVEDAPHALTEALSALAPSSLVVVSDSHVRATRGTALGSAIRPLGVPLTHVWLEPGEESKSLASVQTIWRAAIDDHVDRQSVVLGFGGGVVGDLAGFAASTLLRGLRVVQAPTTLLAMVDASVGGKTGFNLAAGKNLIGSFHQPAAVVADVAHLATLPLRDLVAGLAEVAKVALVCDESLWLELEASAERLRDRDPPALTAAIRRAIAIKARVVRDDEREGGIRQLLNLGHTMGHALEAAGGYSRYRHGEAVALGLVAEVRAAERLDVATPGLAVRVQTLLARLGLPTDVSGDDLAAAWPLVAQDKKRVGADVALPLVRYPGDARLVSVPLQTLARVLGIDQTGIG
jgi:shikimate kinase/3-dehydroquinate synthase